MIVRPEDGRLLLFLQEDHAALAGELAARLERPAAPASVLVAAARMHDNGWREADAHPTLDAERGLPHDYRSIPHAPYRDIWRRGVARAVEADPHAGLLVMLHGAFFLRRSRDPAHRALYDELRLEGDALLARLGLEGTFEEPPAGVARQAEWLRLLDAVSLFVCHDRPDPWRVEADGARYELRREAPGTCQVAPWPFAGASGFEVEMPALLVEGERFEDERALEEALAKARPQVARARLVPG